MEIIFCPIFYDGLFLGVKVHNISHHVGIFGGLACFGVNLWIVVIFPPIGTWFGSRSINLH